MAEPRNNYKIIDSAGAVHFVKADGFTSSENGLLEFYRAGTVSTTVAVFWRPIYCRLNA